MKEWKNPMMTNLGVEETKACKKHTHEKFFWSDSSDSSKDGSSSCSSDCPVNGFES